MDDLISRAAAIDYLMTNIGWRDEDGYEVDDADEKRAIITDLVNGIPAVDAIPVEWLKQIQAGCACDTVQVPMYVAIGWLIDMWQKEQEAQDE